MKRDGQKLKLVPAVHLPTKKAELIFSLPNCLPAGSVPLPQILSQTNGVYPPPPLLMRRSVSSNGMQRKPQIGSSQAIGMSQNLAATAGVVSKSSSTRALGSGGKERSSVPFDNSKEKNTTGSNKGFINLERDNYAQDIARRKMFNLDLHSEMSTTGFIHSISSIAKGLPKKKSRQHKTKFHIAKTSANIQKLSGVICEFIGENKKLIGTQSSAMHFTEKHSVFAQQTLEFANHLIEDRQHFQEKFGFDENNLKRNKCVLEQVVLNRLEKRVKAREKNKQLKKVVENLTGNGKDPSSFDGYSADDIIERMQQPAAPRNYHALALPKIAETNEEN